MFTYTCTTESMSEVDQVQGEKEQLIPSTECKENRLHLHTLCIQGEGIKIHNLKIQTTIYNPRVIETLEIASRSGL